MSKSDDDARLLAHTDQTSQRLANMLEFEAQRFLARAQKNQQKGQSLMSEAEKIRQAGQTALGVLKGKLGCGCKEVAPSTPQDLVAGPHKHDDGYAHDPKAAE